MVCFHKIDGATYVDGRKVLRAWRSGDERWLGVERAYVQESVIDGRLVHDDPIWFGYVQRGTRGEWDYFSQGLLEAMRPRVLETPRERLPPLADSSGLRDLRPRQA